MLITARVHLLVSSLLRAFTLALVGTLVTTTQGYAFSTGHVYNPMSLSNTTGSTYPGHPVYYFVGWTNRFAIDINSPDEYADAPIFMWGAGWTTAQVLTGSNQPIGWTSYSNPSCTAAIGTEYAMAFALNLGNGQSAGLSLTHLSNYHYGPGATVSQGVQVANESYLSSGGQIYAWVAGVCQVTATAPHIHVESARTGTTTLNDWDPISGPAYYPYWYYNYP